MTLLSSFAFGVCKRQLSQFSGLRVGGGARQGDLMRKSAMKIAKISNENHFPTNNNLFIEGRGYVAVVTDIKLFRPRKQGNGKYSLLRRFPLEGNPQRRNHLAKIMENHGK